MKKIHFSKYHGAGNDFIIIDNRSQKIVFTSPDQVAALCHRRFGIGADGLILLEESGLMNFRMKYYNADGNEGSMCGNGGRCITAFAAHLDIIKNNASFEAIDGVHEAVILKKDNLHTFVSLKMNDVYRIEKNHSNYILNTGSPHYITFVDEVEKVNVFVEGKAIRNSEQFKEMGINVNFVQAEMGRLTLRTYERGVEDETMSCGTGSVAAALALALENKIITGQDVEVTTRGGKLFIEFEKDDNGFSNIWLKGPAEKVFEGTFEFSNL